MIKKYYTTFIYLGILTQSRPGNIEDFYIVMFNPVANGLYSRKWVGRAQVNMKTGPTSSFYLTMTALTVSPI